ncbi:MAG TPA: hypothetical protein VFG05_06660 [Methylocella sp.]|nr:hypothetical protein [Methylocella sp.]
MEAFAASQLSQPFKNSDGNWDWPRIGKTISVGAGGIAAVVAGGWAVFKHFAGRKKAGDKKSGDTNITQSGQGAAFGEDITFQGPASFWPGAVHFGLLLQPLTRQLTAKDSQIAALSGQVAHLTKMLLVSAKRPA